jgi:hypothetical protein
MYVVDGGMPDLSPPRRLAMTRILSRKTEPFVCMKKEVPPPRAVRRGAVEAGPIMEEEAALLHLRTR